MVPGWGEVVENPLPLPAWWTIGGMTSKEVFRITATAAATLLLVSLGAFCVYLARHVLLLIAVGAFLAIAMEPAVGFLQRFIKSRKIAVAILLLALVGAISLFIASIVPPILTQVDTLLENIPEYQRQLEDDSTFLGRMEQRFDLTSRLRDGVEGASNALSNFGSVFGTLASALADLLVVLALTVYFLVNLPKLKKQGYELLPTARRRKAIGLIEQVFDKVGGWMEGNILISVIAGFVSFVALLLIGVPFPAALAMWVAIADLIPMVGAMLGAVVCVAVAFFSGIVPGAITLIFFIAYQQIENYVISPRVMKRTVDVSALAVIIAALIGGTLLGPVGVLVAVPAAASLKVIAKELWLAPRAAEAKT